ncbi:restriction endonuclease subunit S [Pseudomonas mandelii]|uniref:Restriction endonuclease subunit S n=1 Tax=Pseudomonas mandelii TaxID=75612 RepID=A0A502I7R5_9PSED|nr:restriction endonuclease subunit S [Pseudomonas mandelii]TPG82133.1 restriction endonuclease subunit S [Pseudomonas mandelii]
MTAPPNSSAYDAYKCSSIRWLEKIPSHWGISRSKHLFSQRIERAKKEDVQLSATQAYGVIPQDQFESMVGRKVVKITLHLDKRKHVEVNDFVISMRSFQGGLERAWAAGCIRSSYVVLRPLKELDSSYYGYLFKSKRYIEALQSTASFIRDGQDLNFYNFSQVDLIFPPYCEQIAIADFLDRKVGLIDQALSVKERQIELLKERKQILVQKAVMLGLDPNVSMKDSGIEWIGEIPAHWVIKRLKYVLEERNERSKTGEEPLFMVSQVHGLVVRSEYHEKAEVAASNVDNKIVFEGDLVFNKLKAHLGVFFKSCIPEKGIVSPDYAVYKRKAYIDDLKLLEYLFRNPSYISQFVVRATGIVEGLIRLYTSELFDMPVPVAPSDEQREILRFIEKVSEKQDKAIVLLEEQITKLKEYKSTMINSAVTGKIKVPGVVEPERQDLEMA